MCARTLIARFLFYLFINEYILSLVECGFVKKKKDKNNEKSNKKKLDLAWLSLARVTKWEEGMKCLGTARSRLGTFYSWARPEYA